DRDPGARGEREAARHAPAAAQLRREAGGSKAHELQPDRLWLYRRRSALVVLARRHAPDLAARGFRHRMRWRQHDVVSRRADQADRKRIYFFLQIFMVRLLFITRLCEHHHAFRAARAVHRAEYRDAAAPDAGQVADRFFELVGADVAAAADDDV